jgi:hypothetical protein
MRPRFEEVGDAAVNRSMDARRAHEALHFARASASMLRFAAATLCRDAGEPLDGAQLRHPAGTKPCRRHLGGPGVPEVDPIHVARSRHMLLGVACEQEPRPSSGSSAC